jgi:phosphotransferase system  glucose/maltose/N-acetylglucosamine-specific IIC component
MRIVSNTKLIKRNKKIGQFLTIGALLVLAIGLYFSFTQPEQITITFGALLFGFLMTQIGIYFGNRWGRSPRPDELLTSGLKGLEDKYTLYHYVTDIPHALIGPAGIIALIPVSVGGTIIYDESKNRFRQKGGNLYLKIFGQEGLGRPEVDAQYTTADLAKFLKKKFPDLEIPDIQPILVFTNPKAKLETGDSPIPALSLEKLKDFIRKKGKEKPVALSLIQQIQKGLPDEDLV